jgi:hypothetical protein
MQNMSCNYSTNNGCDVLPEPSGPSKVMNMRQVYREIWNGRAMLKQRFDLRNIRGARP